MTLEQPARDFFEACETGGGWQACRGYCDDVACFSCQADALAGTDRIERYAEWMKGILGPIPDGRYALTAFAMDAGRGMVIASEVFQGTQTGAGRPGAPTGRPVASDCANVMQFKGERTTLMTNIWNDTQALRQPGWA